MTVEILENITQKHNTRYSQQEHYDCASAFQKSLRGSDADAAIYYLAKMINIVCNNTLNCAFTMRFIAFSDKFII